MYIRPSTLLLFTPKSGTATSPWAVETNATKARNDAFGVGEAARCDDLSTSQALADCLRGLPEKTLTLAIDRVGYIYYNI